MLAQGRVPALDANVTELCTLTGDPLTRVADLTNVILRDPALTTSILTEANSARYSPVHPIRTVSSALVMMGFDRVHLMALGVSIFRLASRDARSLDLYRVLVGSYLSGVLSRGLGALTAYPNPEELFVAGLLAEMPRFLLAGALTEKYRQMEQKVVARTHTLNTACYETFGISYDDFSLEVARFWQLPSEIVDMLSGNGRNGTCAPLLREARQLSEMMFGSQPAGEAALGAAESRLKALLHRDDFDLPAFVRKACGDDSNLSRFFNLSDGDLEMLLRIAEWGKVDGAQVANMLASHSRSEIPAGVEPESPKVTIGEYLTELSLAGRRHNDINHILLLAQEAIQRCVGPAVAVAAFADRPRHRLVGRFLSGRASAAQATDFAVSLADESSPVVRALRSGKPVRSSTCGWEHPFLRSIGVSTLLVVPIVVCGEGVGAYVLGGQEGRPFTAQDELWTEAIAGHVASGFEILRGVGPANR